MGACCSSCCGLCRKDGEGAHSGSGHSPARHHLESHHHYIPVKRRRSQIERDNMSSLVHEVVDTKDFDDQLKEAANKLVVVDFFATWCGPCKIIGPKIHDLAAQFTDVIFLKVDVDECEELATRYKISCMPTFLFFKSGEQVADFSGANETKIKEIVQQLK